MLHNYPQELLNALMEMELRESYVKIELLDWNENFIQELQGIVTTGSISIDGKSSMRRSCNFTMILPDGQNEYELSNIINLNKKFKLYIGYKNHLVEYQSEYGDILWFNMGLYVFITANFNHSTSGATIAVTARDKMCLLNGQVQGTIPESIILHNKMDSNGNITYTKIKDLIYELVNHYGRESASNIFINGVPDYGRRLVKYIGTSTIYLQKSKGHYTGQYDFNKDGDSNYEPKITNDIIGYKKVDFIYPGELISNVGESVTSILDKICNTFGNYEYFYDVDGRFIFQEKQNYLNTSYTPYVQDLKESDYIANYGTGYLAYSFKNNQIISSYANSPKWENIKNDFVIWGVQTTPTGLDIPIHYHLAIDTKPTNNTGMDYRQQLYLADKANPSMASDYWTELSAFWPNIYTQQEEIAANPTAELSLGFKDYVYNDALRLQYWLEILDDQGAYAKYSISNIGRRTYAIEDKDAIFIYPPNVPSLVWVDTDEEQIQGIKDIETFNGYTCVKMPAELSAAVVAANDGKSCFEVAREALYKHLSLQESITIQTLPVLWLEPNTMIEVEDEKANIFGNYIISTLNVPLTYNGNMSITAIRAETRI